MVSRRFGLILQAGLSYLVADVNQQVLAYATLYRPRPAYRYTVENPVYVAENFHTRGIGRALLTLEIKHDATGSELNTSSTISYNAKACSDISGYAEANGKKPEKDCAPSWLPSLDLWSFRSGEHC